MTLQPRSKDGIENFNTLNKYLQNKHIILVFISQRNKTGHSSTVTDIVGEFKIKSQYAYKLIKELESDRSIIKGVKIYKNGIHYSNHTITQAAKTELKELIRVISDSL